MLISDALACFETQLIADGRSHLTLDQYQRHVRMLAFWTSGQRLSGKIEDLGHEHLAGFLASPAATTKSDGKRKKASSMNCIRSSIRTFFRYLHEAGYVTVNPARLIRRAITESPPPRALSEHEEARLLAVLRGAKGVKEERDAVLFRFLLGTGIRLGSALGLEINDLDLEEGVMHVWMKHDRVGRFYLPRYVQEDLRQYIGKRRTGPLFPSPSGHSITTRHAQRRFAMLRGRAALPLSVSPHALRHTFATRLLEKTHDISLVQAALGHQSITSTLVYARIDQARLKKALE